MRRRGEIRSSLRTSALGRSERRARIRASTGRGSRAGCLVLPYALRLVPLISASLMRLTPLASRRSPHAARLTPLRAGTLHPSPQVPTRHNGSRPTRAASPPTCATPSCAKRKRARCRRRQRWRPASLRRWTSLATSIAQQLTSVSMALVWRRPAFSRKRLERVSCCSLQSQPLPPPAPALPPPLPTHLPLPDLRLEQPRLRTPQARSSSGRAAGVRLAAWQGPQLEAG